MKRAIKIKEKIRQTNLSAFQASSVAPCYWSIYMMPFGLQMSRSPCQWAIYVSCVRN